VSLPEILIISINRVLNNEYINNSRLLFKETLDLKDHIDYELFQDNNKKTTYHLYAVNECIHAYRSSHYICYIKLENIWFIFDDDKKVEKFDGLFQNSPFIVGLFYKRDI
jgi:ubiquitin C-terminal hydrolase